MSTRCGCADEGDDLVFSPVHWCTTDASVRGRHADPFSPVPILSEGVAAADIHRELNRLERPSNPSVAAWVNSLQAERDGRSRLSDHPEHRYMETLDESERRGD